MSYQIPLPDPESASQFFSLFHADSIVRIFVDVSMEGKLKVLPVLEGGRAKYLEFQPITGYGVKPIGPQLTNRVSPSFANEVLEHPTQEGFSLDHVYEKLNVFDIEATLYEGRVERLTKLNELRTSKTLLTIVCDMGVFENYIISDISPIMSSGSANAFDVSITFQEVRRIELISPSISSYDDAGVEHGNDTKDEGTTTLTLKPTTEPEEKESIWDTAIEIFNKYTIAGRIIGYIT